MSPPSPIPPRLTAPTFTASQDPTVQGVCFRLSSAYVASELHFWPKGRARHQDLNQNLLRSSHQMALMQLFMLIVQLQQTPLDLHSGKRTVFRHRWINLWQWSRIIYILPAKHLHKVFYTITRNLQGQNDINTNSSNHRLRHRRSNPSPPPQTQRLRSHYLREIPRARRCWSFTHDQSQRKQGLRSIGS